MFNDGDISQHQKNKFYNLAYFKAYLTIPHSNAEEERVFSIARKNKTSFRPRLDLEETLVSIVTVKLAMEFESVSTFNIPQEVLAAAKRATFNVSCLFCS